jgi:hypothetical protein
MLPDFRGFENTVCKRIIKDKHFKEKRMLLNIFMWLPPDNMLMKMA